MKDKRNLVFSGDQHIAFNIDIILLERPFILGVNLWGWI